MEIHDVVAEHLKNTILNYDLIRNIDNDLVLLAILDPGTNISTKLKNRLLKKYKMINYDKIEFLGDAVLELIVREIILKKNLSVPDMAKLTSKIVRNVSLICLMNDRKLCNRSITIKKSCVDVFEAIVGAVYIHLNDYDINVIKIMNNWFVEVWNIENLIDDMINHPDEENMCNAIQRSYNEYIDFDRPSFAHLKTNYEKLEAMYQYYGLGKLNMMINHNQKWHVKIQCPLTLGCQYYASKNSTSIYIGDHSDVNKEVAIEKAALQAIDIIMNDYDLK